MADVKPVVTLHDWVQLWRAYLAKTPEFLTGEERDIFVESYKAAFERPVVPVVEDAMHGQVKR